MYHMAHHGTTHHSTWWQSHASSKQADVLQLEELVILGVIYNESCVPPTVSRTRAALSSSSCVSSAGTGHGSRFSAGLGERTNAMRTARRSVASPHHVPRPAMIVTRTPMLLVAPVGGGLVYLQSSNNAVSRMEYDKNSVEKHVK